MNAIGLDNVKGYSPEVLMKMTDREFEKHALDKKRQAELKKQQDERIPSRGKVSSGDEYKDLINSDIIPIKRNNSRRSNTRNMS